MKFKKFVRLFITIFLILNLLSCGYDTRDWPRIELPFLDSEISTIHMVYDQKPYGKDDKTLYDSLTINDKTMISTLYETTLSFPYEEKVKKKFNKTAYWVKVEMDFTYAKGSSEDHFILTFYSYGVADGVVVFNNEGHFIPGNFVSSFYNTAKEGLN